MIDRQKWDQCISNAANSRVYASGWYLDLVCPDWCGLILGDYEYVMPLPFNRKFGVSYLSQPVYAQQWGVFPVPTATVLTAMLDYLMCRFNYMRLSLNSMNLSDHHGFIPEVRRNFILPLEASFVEIAERYHQNTKRNIRKSKESGLTVKTLGAEEYMNLKRNFPGVEGGKKFQRTLKTIIINALQREKGVIYGAYSSSGELCAAAFFLFDSTRVFYLNAVSTETGKELRAAYAIVDLFITNNSGRSLILDFEGSQNPGVGRFYEGFGATCEYYQHLYRNTLVWPLRLLKK